MTKILILPDIIGIYEGVAPRYYQTSIPHARGSVYSGWRHWIVNFNMKVQEKENEPVNFRNSRPKRVIQFCYKVIYSQNGRNKSVHCRAKIVYIGGLVTG